MKRLVCVFSFALLAVLLSASDLCAAQPVTVEAPAQVSIVFSTNVVQALQDLVAASTVTYAYGFVTGMDMERRGSVNLLSSYILKCSSASVFYTTSATWNQASCEQALWIASLAIQQQANPLLTFLPVDSTTPVVIAPLPSDTTPPVVILTTPTEGSIISGTAVQVSATATDNVGVTKVEFYKGGKLKATVTQPPYGWIWDPTTGGTSACIGMRTHYLEAHAFDAAGNVGISSITVQMDNPAYCPPAPVVP